MSRQIDDNAQPWKQENFSRGLIKNAPHDDLPDNSVAGLVNAHCHDTEIQPRTASYLWSERQPPAWKNDCENPKTGYSASKSGDVITVYNREFSRGDVSCYFVWPDDEPYHDEIQEYLSATQVRVDTTKDRATTNGCHIHGRLNLNTFHREHRELVYQWGKRVYNADINLASREECLCVSRRQPNNVVSASAPSDEYLMIGNSNGIYKLSWDQSVGMLWRANGPVPTVLLEGQQRRKEDKYRHDYLYSMARLNGNGIRSTLTGTQVVQRSGTTRLNTDVDPNRDYSTYWREKPIGYGNLTGGRLQTGELAAANNNPAYWRGIAAPGVSWGFTHNERTENFICDMGPLGYNVQNMDEVAAALQATINTLFSWIEVEWDEDGYLVFTTGRERNATLGYLTAGVGGTNVAAILRGLEWQATLNNSWNYTAPNQVGIVYNPVDQDIPEWHWNHYTLWRTTNISENGADPRTTEDGEELQPLKFTYCGDYRIAAAFYARKSRGGIVTAEIGTFEKADEGTPLEWEDGDVDTIIEYISPTQVRVGHDYYYAETKPLQACAIGGGRVMRASQSGDIVTLRTELNNDLFSHTGCDVRKTIYWSDGYWSVIVEDLGNNRVRVHDSAERTTQGITLDPVCRVITDVFTDETLRQLMDEKHVGLLNARFHDAMPNCNILEVVPGFMLCAQRTESLIYYCDLPDAKKYSAGYHLINRQIIDKVEGSIQLIKRSPNYFVVWCNDSTWIVPTNNPDIKKLPEFGEWYGVLHADVIDEQIGVVDWGGIQEIEPGAFQMLCADGTWRQLIGLKYSSDLMVDPNTGQDRLKNDFDGNWNLGTGLYTRNLGHIWWGAYRRETVTPIVPGDSGWADIGGGSLV